LHFVSPIIDVDGVLLAAPRSSRAILSALSSMLASCGSRNRLVRKARIAHRRSTHSIDGSVIANF
jgi:hypothetical protein